MINDLVSKYPELFSGDAKYIDCGDGWTGIVDAFCSVTRRHMKSHPACTPVFFSQVKEKFGGLRLYYYGGDEYIRGAAMMAEACSFQTCERCGNAGRPNERGWITTLCDACRLRTTDACV